MKYRQDLEVLQVTSLISAFGGGRAAGPGMLGSFPVNSLQGNYIHPPPTAPETSLLPPRTTQSLRLVETTKEAARSSTDSDCLSQKKGFKHEAVLPLVFFLTFLFPVSLEYFEVPQNKAW